MVVAARSGEALSRGALGLHLFVVTPAEFKQTLSDDAPPAKIAAPLAALWWAARGDWDKAHTLVMNDDSREAAWVHAYLHRVEGDLGNAAYWYRAAQRPMPDGALTDELDGIVSDLSGPRS
jgi:hypothetical protein